MGYDFWNESKFLQHKVRNLTRRGWLLKVKNDGKMLTGRVKTGDKIENDGLDIIQPVGLMAHVKPSEKTEILTMDVGADTSRRVILSIFGDREQYPKQPDENEVFLYAPGEKEGKMHLRIKKKKDKKDGDGQSRAGDGDDKDSSGNKDSGRPDGMHWNALKSKISGQTEATFQSNADEGQGFSTKDGSVDIKAGKNTQFEAKKHIRKGEHHTDGESYVQGNVHANDHFAGGGTTIQSAAGRAEGGSSEDKPDGSKEWQANGRKGQVSLLQTASLVGLLQGMLNSFMQSQGQQNQQQQQQNEQQQQTNQEQEQTNEQTSDLIQQLLARITALEEQVQQLQSG